ncbi:hypothetical protein GCM10009624_17830 [Gordonia sinesedis]
MTDPYSAIPEEAQPALWRRYDQWRGARHIRFAERHATKLPRWRNRRTYRRLVVLQAMSLLALFVAAVLAYFSMKGLIVPFLIGLLGTFTCQYLLRIVTGSIGDAPVTALDEFQLAQRNSARSISFFVLFSLMFIPYLVLIVLGSQDTVDGQLVYGTAILLITLMLTAVTLPNMLIAWWMNDPDPEDIGAPTISHLTARSSEPTTTRYRQEHTR